VRYAVILEERAPVQLRYAEPSELLNVELLGVAKLGRPGAGRRDGVAGERGVGVLTSRIRAVVREVP
jgi:hypothetical protein